MDILADQRHSSGDVSKLLSRILIRHLEKQYQVGRKDTHKLHEGQILTIVDLISWDVWPIMIKITRKLSFHNYYDVYVTFNLMQQSSCHLLKDDEYYGLTVA